MAKSWRWLHQSIVFLLLVGTSILTVQATEKTEVRLGVFAIHGASATEEKYRPLVDYLNRTLDDEFIELVVLPHEEMMQAIGNRELDMVTTNPSHFLDVRESEPLTGVLATLVEKTADGRPLNQFGGAIITRADRFDITRLEDLPGTVIATASTGHMGGFRAQAYELAISGVDIERQAQSIEQLGNHVAAVRAVLDGQADVAFVRDGVLEQMAMVGDLDPEQIKLVNARYAPHFPHMISTRLYPEWPVFALSYADQDAVRHIASALLAIEPDNPAAKAAGIYGYTIPADYHVVEDLARTLRLPPFDAPPDFTWKDAWERWAISIAGVSVLMGLVVLMAVGLYWQAWRERGARDRFETLLSALGEGVYGTDKQGNCTFINQAALDLLDVREDDLLGKNQHELFHHHYPDGRPYPQEECPIHKTAHDGQTRRVEERFFRRDGHDFPVDLVTSPIVDKGNIIGSVAAFSDISARKRATAEAERLAERNRLLLESAGQGIFGVDADGLCTFINPAGLKLLGLDEDKVIGQDQHMIFHRHYPDGRVYPHEECPIHKTLLDGRGRQTEEVFYRADGSPIDVHVKVAPIYEFGQQNGAVVAFEDITETKKMRAKLLEMAVTDELTGLSNRRSFSDQLEQEYHRVVRYKHPSCVLMLDLDHFKKVNDAHGHAAGDRVLREFAALLMQSVRKADIPARIGGEEFAVLLPETELEAAGLLAERIRRRLEQLIISEDGVQITITVSIGVTQIKDQDPNADTAMVRADRALYQAKEAGRNQVNATT